MKQFKIKYETPAGDLRVRVIDSDTIEGALASIDDVGTVHYHMELDLKPSVHDTVDAWIRHALPAPHSLRLVHNIFKEKNDDYLTAKASELPATRVAIEAGREPTAQEIVKDIVFGAFSFMNTPEGPNYWADVGNGECATAERHLPENYKDLYKELKPLRMPPADGIKFIRDALGGYA